MALVWGDDVLYKHFRNDRENGQEQSSLRLWFSENLSLIEFDDEGVPKSDQIDCIQQQT